MTTLVWDEIGTRFYEKGVDRGVLYLPDGNGVPWNGLLSVVESNVGNESSPVYFDGIRFANIVAPGEYSATITAYTYPDEFLPFEGVVEVNNGLYVANQRVPRFGLSYRTHIGSDEDQEEGYKIHVVYNLSAVPSQKNYQTVGDAESAIQFSWTVSAMPVNVSGFQPTAHLIFDTRKMSSLLLEDIENTLYGTNVKDAALPPLEFFVNYIDSWVIMRITDNLDGTWTATGPDSMITMLDSTTFQIDQANAVYLDSDTYAIADLTY